MRDLTWRAVRLATGLWTTPERLRDAVAALLARGAPTDPASVITALEATATPARPLPHDDDVEATWRRLQALRADIRIATTAEYPRRLADAWPELGAPLWLFTCGAGGGLGSGRAVAVVGTRRPSLDGLRTAERLGRLLAEHGVVVVSGLARGIDQAAHRSALEAGGTTVAVLGTGLGVDYPARSRGLQDDIAACGTLVTEYPPGTPPRPVHFLWRNRVIAGLADATVVVEGRERSGALQTARLAAAQGREVLAVPGSINQPTSRGPLGLIRDGATAVTALEDVLEVVGAVAARRGEPAGRGVDGLDPGAEAVLALLGPVPATPGALAAETGRSLPAVLAAVADLCARGLATSTGRGITRGAAEPRPTDHGGSLSLT